MPAELGQLQALTELNLGLLGLTLPADSASCGRRRSTWAARADVAAGRARPAAGADEAQPGKLQGPDVAAGRARPAAGADGAPPVQLLGPDALPAELGQPQALTGLYLYGCSGLRRCRPSSRAGADVARLYGCSGDVAAGSLGPREARGQGPAREAEAVGGGRAQGLRAAAAGVSARHPPRRAGPRSPRGQPHTATQHMLS